MLPECVQGVGEQYLYGGSREARKLFDVLALFADYGAHRECWDE